MAVKHGLLLWFCVALIFLVVSGRRVSWPELRLPSEKVVEEDGVGTRWAVLVAGSQGFGNYRHQADVCHAYQVLKKGGLKDENIVVFMYDDIADNPLNPRPGLIINHPQGNDVYAGVPKDYTKEQVNTANLYAALLGNKSAIQGGSGKVVDSKPEDHIFLFFSDHGGPGVLGMPNIPFLYAKDFIGVLKTKHKMGTYKEMVMYIESCESGSIFEGLMPTDLNIYVTTASNAEESSFGTYCPGMNPPPPPGYMTCIGDLYAVSWMEDSETHNLQEETIKEQYDKVKLRTSNFNTFTVGSHVMEYGSKQMKSEKLYLYQGFNLANANITSNNAFVDFPIAGIVNQRDAELLFLWERYKVMDASKEKENILEEITNTMLHRLHVDKSIDSVGKLLFGARHGPAVLNQVRGSGRPLVDDWVCLKKTVRVFEEHCGSLTQYGMKHMRGFANICNRVIDAGVVEEACESTCKGNVPAILMSAKREVGYSA